MKSQVLVDLDPEPAEGVEMKILIEPSSVLLQKYVYRAHEVRLYMHDCGTYAPYFWAYKQLPIGKLVLSREVWSDQHGAKQDAHRRIDKNLYDAHYDSLGVGPGDVLGDAQVDRETSSLE